MRKAFRSTAVRWALGVALWSAFLSLSSFAFTYWQTADFMREELTESIEVAARSAARDPASAAANVEAWIDGDLHATHFGSLFAADGSRRVGNISTMPPDLPLDGEARRVDADVTIGDRRLGDQIWASGSKLTDGSVVVIGHDTDEVDRVQTRAIRAAALGIAPTLILSGLGGILLAGRARRRLASTELAVARVMQGDLRQRLPIGKADDEFDRLAGNVNLMLDEIERLVEEVRSVGDAIAHDLRTPLTRMRTRLERTRSQARTVPEFQDAIDLGLDWIDQTLAMVAAVLRIGEIEHDRRRIGFASVDLDEMIREVAEFFEPVAQEKNISISKYAQGNIRRIKGDRDLLFEALSNVIDNAMKFTLPGKGISIGLEQVGTTVLIAVEDTGPGIPSTERAQVFNRFYRGERSRQTEGHGLGLALVAAIAKLHGFTLEVTDSRTGGCRFIIACPATTAV